jgi:putative two-component system response regulator
MVDRLHVSDRSLVARVFAVVDALDPMTCGRPYRAARRVEEAVGVLKEEAGRRFDPRVVEAARALGPARWGALLG